MLHQCTALAETIKEYNLFYDSILNNGLVHEWTYDEAVKEREKKFGVRRSDNVVGGYIPFELINRWERAQPSSQTDSIKNNIRKKLFDSGVENIKDEAHDVLRVLLNELDANENLEYLLSKRLETLPGKRLIIKSPEV
jgi:hypothetical protein